MKNKQVKHMILTIVSETQKKKGKVDYFGFTSKGLYAWHHPPVEGWFKFRNGTVSLTADQLKAINGAEK